MIKQNQPLISIITVCLNSAKTIAQTIESVLNQTYTNIEYILIDGVSTDNTLDIIKIYSIQFADKGISYKFISEADNGLYDAMNKGIKLATGEWIGIINSDDWYELDACTQLFNNTDVNNYDIVYGLVQLIDVNNHVESIEQRMFDSVLSGSMQHQGIFVKKSLHNDIGLYSMQYKLASDYDFLLKCKLANKSAKFVMQIIANFRITCVSNQTNWQSLALIEHYKVLYNNQLISLKKLLIEGYLKAILIFLKNKLS